MYPIPIYVLRRVGARLCSGGPTHGEETVVVGGFPGPTTHLEGLLEPILARALHDIAVCIVVISVDNVRLRELLSKVMDFGLEEGVVGVALVVGASNTA